MMARAIASTLNFYTSKVPEIAYVPSYQAGYSEITVTGRFLQDFGDTSAVLAVNSLTSDDP